MPPVSHLPCFRPPGGFTGHPPSTTLTRANPCLWAVRRQGKAAPRLHDSITPQFLRIMAPLPAKTEGCLAIEGSKIPMGPVCCWTRFLPIHSIQHCRSANFSHSADQLMSMGKLHRESYMMFISSILEELVGLGLVVSLCEE